MNLSSQGLNFLGLTAKKFAPTGISERAQCALEQRFEEFEQTSNAFANTTVALENLKSVNCKAFFIQDGEKVEISEKAWDRGGILEGKLPLEEGIQKGIYHIEQIQPPTEKAEINIDKALEELKSKIQLEEAAIKSKTGKKLPDKPSKEKHSMKLIS